MQWNCFAGRWLALRDFLPQDGYLVNHQFVEPGVGAYIVVALKILELQLVREIIEQWCLSRQSFLRSLPILRKVSAYIQVICIFSPQTVVVALVLAASA